MSADLSDDLPISVFYSVQFQKKYLWFALVPNDSKQSELELHCTMYYDVAMSQFYTH